MYVKFSPNSILKNVQKQVEIVFISIFPLLIANRVHVVRKLAQSGQFISCPI